MSIVLLTSSRRGATLVLLGPNSVSTGEELPNDGPARYENSLPSALRSARRAVFDLTQPALPVHLPHPQPGAGEDQVDGRRQAGPGAVLRGRGHRQDHPGAR